MHLNTILSPARTLCRARVVSRKRFFETVSGLIADDLPALAREAVFSRLLAREKLGSTALGDGVAIPHCRMSQCAEPVASLVTLAEPVDFEAADRQGVDIFFVLLAPERGGQRNLDILAELAGLLRQASFRQGLRDAADERLLFEAAVRFAP